MVRYSTTADQVLVRKLNTSLIMECLRTSGPLSRAGLSDATGLNRSTVSSIVHDLLGKNLIREIGLQSSTRTGRPGILLELNPDGGCAIGVEIGVDFISAVLTDFVARVLWRRRIAVHPEEKQEVIIRKAEAIVEEALAIGKERGLLSLGIGLGVPGLVDIQEGTLVFAPNLRWYNVPLRQMWTERFDLPVYVENEANAAALGEYYFGNARGVQNLIYLSAGVGLGGGIIIKGKLFRGSNGYAGEFGHMTVDPNGEPCGCGKRGCWETMVGPRAITRRVRKALENGRESSILSVIEKDPNRIDMGVVVQAAQAGDPIARTALEDVGVCLGIGISNLVNAFNPEMVVLGGALSLAGPFLLPVIEETVRIHALPQPRAALTITTSAHGADACVMGAVALVLDEILREPMLPML
ncbi:MAG: ROK family transcriptional regulator [Anaerolineae bacterium]|nr:ROK family protein [Anaerolineae bacterium]MDW8068586.1 ROK family transcriptional regulator [Anaerolineae bacterium]